MLWQNDLDIARGVCHMQVPVVVAVGHTQDTSILEQVAYAHAKTPSDAAHLIISYYEQWHKQCDGLYEEIREAITNKIHHYLLDIPHCRESIQYACQQKFRILQDKVKMLYDSIYQYHPQVLLRHGYAYLTQKGEIVSDTDVGKLKTGDPLTITTATHHIETKVESIETRE
ncbi:MAG: exodeoxyribonuclease VII large subunit [bacterium]